MSQPQRTLLESNEIAEFKRIEQQLARAGAHFIHPTRLATIAPEFRVSSPESAAILFGGMNEESRHLLLRRYLRVEVEQSLTRQMSAHPDWPRERALGAAMREAVWSAFAPDGAVAGRDQGTAIRSLQNPVRRLLSDGEGIDAFVVMAAARESKRNEAYYGTVASSLVAQKFAPVSKSETARADGPEHDEALGAALVWSSTASPIALGVESLRSEPVRKRYPSGLTVAEYSQLSPAVRHELAVSVITERYAHQLSELEVFGPRGLESDERRRLAGMLAATEAIAGRAAASRRRAEIDGPDPSAVVLGYNPSIGHPPWSAADIVAVRKASERNRLAFECAADVTSRTPPAPDLAAHFEMGRGRILDQSELAEVRRIARNARTENGLPWPMHPALIASYGQRELGRPVLPGDWLRLKPNDRVRVLSRCLEDLMPGSLSTVERMVSNDDLARYGLSYDWRRERALVVALEVAMTGKGTTGASLAAVLVREAERRASEMETGLTDTPRRQRANEMTLAP